MRKPLLLKEVSAYTKQVANDSLSARQQIDKSHMVYASETIFLQLQNGHVALHESLITQLTLSVMREQSRLRRRLPHLTLKRTQRHIVRAGASVCIGSTSEDTVYAHRDHFNISLNGHVSPVTESELRHLNRQKNRCKNRDSGFDSTCIKSGDDSIDDDDYSSPRKLHLLQGTNLQEPVTYRSMTEADLVEYARNFSGQRPEDNYVNL